MKPETKSFYEKAVERAVRHIAEHLDEALDLVALARLAALSPFHFHRVFRGMVGETPLELHRRLRLERAACRLLQGDGNVTRVAFESGYETHEAFTRAFRAVYGVPPSAFREERALREEGRAAEPSCRRPPPFELSARSGVHFRPGGAVTGLVPFAGGISMDVVIKEMPEARLGTVLHRGPYSRIKEAFAKLGAIAGPAGLFRNKEAAMIGVYYDDPDTTPPEALRSEAAIAVPEGAPLPEGLTETRIPAGRYACTVHVGPPSELGDAWARFMGEWLPKSGYRVGEGVTFELYTSDMATVPMNEMRTELYLPIA